MNDQELQIQYELPLSGDIVFVLSQRAKHPVRKYQKALRKPFPDIVHVASLVTPFDVMETTFGKRAFTASPSDWRKAREEDDCFLILRNTGIDMVEKQGRMTKAGAYFLDEEYAIRDALGKKPHRLGYSICSVLTQKILIRAELLADDDLPTDRNILPGEFLVGLKELGWTELSSPGYFEDQLGRYVPISPISVFRSSLAHRKKMRSLDDLFESIDRAADLAGISQRDLLTTESRMMNKNVYDVLAAKIPLIVRQNAYMQNHSGEGAAHWTEENITPVVWAKRREANNREISELSDSIYELNRDLISSLQGHRFPEIVGNAVNKWETENTIDPEITFEIVQIWSQEELKFATMLGLFSWNFPNEMPQLDYSALRDDASYENAPP